MVHPRSQEQWMTVAIYQDGSEYTTGEGIEID